MTDNKLAEIWDLDGVARSVNIEGVFEALLAYADPNSARQGLEETPARMAKAWRFMCSGYDEDPAAVLKAFDDGAEGYDEMVTVKDIPIYSRCEHHLESIFGTATISYIPQGRVVGLSKLARVADIFARRLQVQERLTVQIADCLVEHVSPHVGVQLHCRHMCIEARGVQKQGTVTVTTAMRGAYRDQAATRHEFLMANAAGKG